MCLILLAYKVHPQYELILIANRDEFYNRPTLGAHWWADAPILGGKDLEGNGTWLGVDANGRLAALTNYRDGLLLKTNAPSRGVLPSAFLGQQQLSAQEYTKTLLPTADVYNGYNLLLYDGTEICCFSNITKQTHRLEAGIYGLSNHLLDTPWQKVKKGKTLIANLLKMQDFSVETAFEGLRNVTLAADDELPQTNIPHWKEKQLSAMFIEMEGYGTRCSTVFLKKYNGDLVFEERSFVPIVEKVSFEWKAGLVK